MAPIRVGFLGLSKSGWAPGAHLPYLKESDKYQIVAICNSSVESSEAAIELYNLPSTTKAYADPEGALFSISLPLLSIPMTTSHVVWCFSNLDRTGKG